VGCRGDVAARTWKDARPIMKLGNSIKSTGVGDSREVSMRLSMLSLFLIAAALLGEIQAASAQSPTSYPWCSRYFGRGMGGATSCYYSSYAQCMATVSGIGGYCYRSPYYHAAPDKAARRHRGA
jgi:Protein of unknown function (DUF3551)